MPRPAAAPPPPPRAQAGFTLIELLVSLAIFALISVAGVGMITSLADIKQRTEGRSARLAEVQRALFLLTADFEQLAAGPIADGATVGIMRGSARGDYPVAYRLAGTALHRITAGHDMVLVDGIGGLGVRFWKDGAWTQVPFTAEDPARPQAVEVTVGLAPQGGMPGGVVRRIVELPADPAL